VSICRVCSGWQGGPRSRLTNYPNRPFPGDPGGGPLTILLGLGTGTPPYAAIETVQTAGTVEDTCQRTNFYYDANQFDGAFSQYSLNGRLTAKQWGGTGCPAPYQFTDMYSYTPGGLVTKKRLKTQNAASQTFQLKTSQPYDNEGKALTVKYPDTSGVTGLTYTYTYDGLGRPIKLTDNQSSPRDWVSNVQYGRTTAAGN
jgi:YD repeat-containing protein